MTRPLFEVGEQVILQSKQYPQYNGEYFIEYIIFKGAAHKCRLTGKLLCKKSGAEFVYILDQPFASKKVIGSEVGFNESALRKKHKPSDLSFGDLMVSLVSNKQACNAA
jgi:hypothetical protein